MHIFYSVLDRNVTHIIIYLTMFCYNDFFINHHLIDCDLPGNDVITVCYYRWAAENYRTVLFLALKYDEHFNPLVPFTMDQVSIKLEVLDCYFMLHFPFLTRQWNISLYDNGI